MFWYFSDSESRSSKSKSHSNIPESKNVKNEEKTLSNDANDVTENVPKEKSSNSSDKKEN